MTGPSDEAREKYLQQQVEGASKEELLMMLLDGALKFLKKAEDAFDAEKWDELHNWLCRVQNIFLELALTLDVDSGDFASKLADIYGFIHSLLIQANVDRDREAFEESRRLITEVRGIWADAIASMKASESPVKVPVTAAKDASKAPKRINVTG